MTRWSPIRGLAGALIYRGLFGLGGILVGVITSIPLRGIATPRKAAEA